ncbi:unnamed protein product [Adineta steineri]|uniref:Uncharacterized protein n=1 Tax=Adineta steineri TaxID=433720 RepID=A0A819ZJS7_9BILA|nr:unnamed protein product [Adineta steineri]CAF4178190.1 unnamed protein product [Adineta steineri]
MKTGKNPTHPVGIHRINADSAQIINKQYSLVIESGSREVCEGDKICTSCLRRLLNDEKNQDHNDLDNVEMMNTGEEDPSNVDIGHYDDKGDTEYDNSKDDKNIEDLPSSQERTYNNEQARTKLNLVFELLNIPTIRDVRRSKNIRQNVDRACSILYKLCDMLVDCTIPLNDHQLSMNDASELLSGLKKLFHESGEDEQIRLLTISPDGWGRTVVEKWFGCTEHQARMGLHLKINKGVLAYPEYSNGNKPLPDNTVQLIKEFYLSDGISRASARKRDVIHIKKVPFPVQFMEMTGREAYQQFKSEYPNVVVGKSSFNSLRPRQVKCLAPADTCLCIYHENFYLLLKSWNKMLKEKSLIKDDVELIITDKYLVNRIVCGIPGEDCYNGRCDTCGIISPSDILLQNIMIDDDEQFPWSQWITANNKIDLLHINGSVSSFLDEINNKWKQFLLHWYITTVQKEYIKSIRLNSSFTTHIVAQLDFAENYSIFYQREIQSYHWNNDQVTIFTVQLKVGSVHKNIVIISNYMLHNTAFVYVAQSIIVNYIKQHFPFIQIINYLSDGAGSQFKNNYNMFNLLHHLRDFGIQACWTFSSTGHGKGPIDGLGASSKSTATRSVKSSGTVISSAKEFYEFTKQYNENAAKLSGNNEPPINAFYVDSTTVEATYQNFLKPRWDKLNKTDHIKQIRSFHQFNIRSENVILCKQTSSSLDYMTTVYRTENTTESTVTPVHTVTDISIDTYVITKYNDKLHLAKIKSINYPAQEIQVIYYEPEFPATIFYVSRLKNRHGSNINVQNIILLLRRNPTIGKQNEVYIDHEQYNDITNLSEQL